MAKLKHYSTVTTDNVKNLLSGQYILNKQLAYSGSDIVYVQIIQKNERNNTTYTPFYKENSYSLKTRLSVLKKSFYEEVKCSPSTKIIKTHEEAISYFEENPEKNIYNIAYNFKKGWVIVILTKQTSNILLSMCFDPSDIENEEQKNFTTYADAEAEVKELNN